MGPHELLELTASYCSPEEQKIIQHAYEYAKQAHGDQVRASGEPYITHPAEVAKILARLRLDAPTIAAALLHDVAEDTTRTIKQIETEFGREVATLVEGVTKLTAISRSQEDQDEDDPDGKSRAMRPVPGRSKQDTQAENLRKIFLAMAKDIRVILMKLADRLHNLRTLSHLPLAKRRYIARETLEIFAPLTHRLGMWRFKWELEDLAFSYLEPERYKELVEKVAKKRAAREDAIREVVFSVEERLSASGIKAQIDGRPKHLYSIYQKMSKKEKQFEEIYDLTAIRIIVPAIEDCYAALGIVHGLWMPIPDRIKDYIAKPKSNNYRSLHTTVYGPGQEPLEIQIRSEEMHQIAEYGIAAHWRYKAGAKTSSGGRGSVDKKVVLPWLKEIAEWQRDFESAKDFVQAFRIDLLESQVFVFTPKGDVIDLPAGSTPLDFAYRIHTEIGHKCVGAKANGKIVSLDYQFQNGDIVEVLTAKNSTGPSLDWLRYCRTSGAKHKIRTWFKKENREENIARGEALVERECHRHRLDQYLGQEELWLKVTQRLNIAKLEDLYAAIGYGDLGIQAVITRLKEEVFAKESVDIIVPVKKPGGAVRKPKRSSTGIRVKGVDNILIRFSKCCNPLPGDEIIGYVTLGKGVSVHRQDCPNLKDMESRPERVLEVSWDLSAEETIYPVEVELECWDKPGLLGEIMNVINDLKVGTRACKAWTKREKAIVRLVLEVMNLNQLKGIMNKLGHVKEVIQVTRLAHSDNGMS